MCRRPPRLWPANETSLRKLPGARTNVIPWEMQQAPAIPRKASSLADLTMVMGRVQSSQPPYQAGSNLISPTSGKVTSLEFPNKNNCSCSKSRS